MNKVIRDSKVAVLYSPGFGAGWRSWDHEYGDVILFDPWIVDILLNKDYERDEQTKRILSHCAIKYPNMYTGGVTDLQVEWIPQGVAFRIDEYDGSETIEYRDMTDWIIA